MGFGFFVKPCRWRQRLLDGLGDLPSAVCVHVGINAYDQLAIRPYT